jgi:hypothetical protein
MRRREKELVICVFGVHLLRIRTYYIRCACYIHSPTTD